MKTKAIAALVLAASMVASMTSMASGTTAALSHFPQPTVAEAAKKSGFVKSAGKWVYYKGGKKVTGLQKLSGKLYYFDKKGVMKSGLLTVSGSRYYFSKAKDGKAPALMGKTKKVSGTTWYFGSNGKGYVSVGNTKGNQAAETILGAVKFTEKMTQEQKLKAAYDYMASNLTYLGRGKPENLSSDAWIYDKAAEMAEKKNGNCYNYSAATYVVAKALGFDAKLIVGERIQTADLSEDDSTPVDGKKYMEHAWVQVKNGSTWLVLDTQMQGSRNNKDAGNKNYYMVTLSDIEGYGWKYRVVE